MDIISTKKMLLDAKKERYAVPAFNIHNLETMQGVVEGAWEMKSPVIVATTPGTVKHADMDYLVALIKAASKKYNIPIALHLDHCTDIGFLKQCIKAGYRSVMIDGSAKTYEENIEMTREVVEFAKKYKATVEAELGRVGGEEEHIKVDEKDAMLTDPNVALEFVEKTGVDSLAVAIGTAHGVYKLPPKLDFDRLKTIESIVDVPIVLHGASGVAEESVKKAIEYGICKVNIATEIKIPFADAVKKYFKENPDGNDPRHYLSPGKEAAKKVIKEKIKICGSGGR